MWASALLCSASSSACRDPGPRSWARSATQIYEDQTTYRQLSSIANIKIFRFKSSLYYANIDYFKTVLYQKTGLNPILLAARHQRVESQANADTGNGERFFGTGFDCLKPAKTRAEKSPPDVCPPSVDTHTLIIDCGAMQFIDTVGFSMLKDTHHDNKEIGVQVLLANCSPSIRHSVLMQRRLLSSGIRCIKRAGRKRMRSWTLKTHTSRRLCRPVHEEWFLMRVGLVCASEQFQFSCEQSMKKD